jgi:hypothetical protein
MLRRVVRFQLTDVSAVVTTSIVRDMSIASTSETSVNLGDTTWRNIPEDSHVHNCRRENLKFHHCMMVSNVTPDSNLPAIVADLS